jgi:hypothetical protein
MSAPAGPEPRIGALAAHAHVAAGGASWLRGPFAGVAGVIGRVGVTTSGVGATGGGATGGVGTAPGACTQRLATSQRAPASQSPGPAHGPSARVNDVSHGTPPLGPGRTPRATSSRTQRPRGSASQRHGSGLGQGHADTGQ